MQNLYLNPECSDVTFVVEGEKLPAHKSILAGRSSYFRAMLFGGLAEATQREVSLNVPLDTFKIILKYVYSGCLSLRKIEDEEILELLGLTDEYGIDVLKLAIAADLKANIHLENCCSILDAALLYKLQTLSDACLKFMDRNATEVLGSSGFKTLSQDSLCALLDRDSFFASEVNILNAVSEWCLNNPNKDQEVCLIRKFCNVQK